MQDARLEERLIVLCHRVTHSVGRDWELFEAARVAWCLRVLGRRLVDPYDVKKFAGSRIKPQISPKCSKDEPSPPPISTTDHQPANTLSETTKAKIL